WVASSTQSAWTGGCRSTRRSASSETTWPCRATSTRRCCRRRGPCSKRTCATSSNAAARRRGTSSISATACRRRPIPTSSPASCSSPTASSEPRARNSTRWKNRRMTAEQSAELAARAAAQHVVVIGGGIGGLVAARECAKVGMRVTLLEARSQLGGSIRSAELDGIVVDAGAESFATRGGHVRKLVEELGLSDAIVKPEGGGAWLSGIPDAPDAPLPKGGLLGIPANPFQEDVRAIIG